MAVSLNSGTRSRVIVLGEKGSADLIAKELEESGFETLRLQQLPSISDPKGPEQLKSILSGFPNIQWIHPGVGPWAERPELPNIAQELGIGVICPSTKVLSLFANRLNLLAKAEEVQIPTLVLGADPFHSIREVENFVESRNHKFPFVLRAVRGGGSFGTFVLYETSDFETRLPLWLEQLRYQLGEVILFPEKYIEGARRIVVPFARLGKERITIFTISDASLTCRFKKVVEFAPAEGLDPMAVKQVIAWTKKFAEEVEYNGVGTFEFLVDGPRAFFVEGLPRLNTDFHLWEMVVGTQAVKWQLAALNPEFKVAIASSPRSQTAIAVRLYAEDAILQLPQPGQVKEITETRKWEFDGDCAAEFTNGLNELSVSPHGTGLIGILWVRANSRKQALTLSRGVLNDFWIAGSLQTNERFLSELLMHPWVQEGVFHAGFIDEEFIPNVRPPKTLMPIFISVCESLLTPDARSSIKRWAVGDQWAKNAGKSNLNWTEPPTRWSMDGMPGISGVIQLDAGRSEKLRVCAFPLSADGRDEMRWQVRIGQWTFMVRGVSCPKSSQVLSLVSGKVHSILYRENAVIPAHDPILFVESLQMLIPHALPVEVRISRWKVSAEEIVSQGQELADLEILAKN